MAPNFTTVEASNGAKLEVWFDRLNIRPYANTLLIRIGRGYLRAGDTLTIRLGDRRQGSPGFRLQTNCEERVELRTSVDAFATYEFTELPPKPKKEKKKKEKKAAPEEKPAQEGKAEGAPPAAGKPAKNQGAGKPAEDQA